MKQLKRSLVLVLAIVCLFAMTACGSKTEEKDEPFKAGTSVDSVYTSEFFGIKCELDAQKWVLHSNEQLLQANGLESAENVDEALAKKLAEKATVYDMSAMTTDSMANINIVIEDLGALYGKMLDASGYVDIVIEKLPSALAEAGYTDPVCEKVELTIAGQKTYGTSISGTVSGIAVYQKQACIKSGNYMAVVTVSSFIEDTTDEMLALFTAAA